MNYLFFKNYDLIFPNAPYAIIDIGFNFWDLFDKFSIIIYSSKIPIITLYTAIFAFSCVYFIDIWGMREYDRLYSPNNILILCFVKFCY
jgi:hypothetical protein